MTADALPAHLEKGERASPVELPRQKEKPALPNEVTTIYVVRLFGVGLKKNKTDIRARNTSPILQATSGEYFLMTRVAQYEKKIISKALKPKT